MSNQWFRLYAEILNDPKVQIVTEALRWRYVALLCLQCNGNYENRPDDEIALSLRVTVEEWLLTRQEFIKRELLTTEGKISGWEKRQYISDIKDQTAAERQKRYRDRKRNDRNGGVTSRLPEADTETETETETEKKDPPIIPQEPEPPPAGQREDFFEKCFTFITARFPQLVPSNTAPIHQWREAGYDFETQVKPTVESAAAKGVKAKSFNYFTSMLEELAAKKMAAAPVVVKPIEVTPEQKERNKAWMQKMGMESYA